MVNRLNLVLILTLATVTSQANETSKVYRNVASEEYKILLVPADFNKARAEASKDNLNQILPSEVKDGDSSSLFASRVGDKVIQNWLNSDAGSGVARSVKTVENSMRAEATIGNSKLGTEHKFGFNVQALQGCTELKYSGWTKALMKYSARENSTIFEVNEKVFSNKDLFLNHTVTSVEGKSSMGVRWNW